MKTSAHKEHQEQHHEPLTRPVTAFSNSCSPRKASALALSTKSISSRTKGLGRVGDLSHFASPPAKGADGVTSCTSVIGRVFQ